MGVEENAEVRKLCGRRKEPLGCQLGVGQVTRLSSQVAKWALLLAVVLHIFNPSTLEAEKGTRSL